MLPVGLTPGVRNAWEVGEKRSVRDVWAGAEAGEAAGSYSAEVPAWGVALLVLS